MLSKRSAFFLAITAFLVGASSNVDASKHSQTVRSSEFQRRARTLGEVNETNIIDEDHLDADHADEDHVDEDHLDEDSHDEDSHDEDGHDEDGHDEDGHDEDKPWGKVIFAALLINLASLIGVIFLVGSFASKKYHKSGVALVKEHHKWNFTHNIIPSFACGALLATSLFLILPESFNLISDYAAEQQAGEDEHDAHRMLEDHGDEDEDHVDTDVPVAWRFGVSVIGGFLLPIVTSLIFSHEHEPEVFECDDEVAAQKIVEVELSKDLAEASTNIESKVGAGVADDSVLSNADPTAIGELCEDTSCKEGEHHGNDDASGLEPEVALDGANTPLKKVTPINYSLASSVLLGDFFHNFTDGIFIGTAFMLCDNDLAISVAAATVYHELAQELADYFLLTEHCNIRPDVALALNFASGLSVLFGALLILSADVNYNTMGCLLAIGAGVYLYIAAAECLPRARSAQKNTKDKLMSLVSFVFGVLPIGLVLLNHGHCEATH
jgi:zinc transporter ZupT